MKQLVYSILLGAAVLTLGGCAKPDRVSWPIEDRISMLETQVAQLSELNQLKEEKIEELQSELTATSLDLEASRTENAGLTAQIQDLTEKLSLAENTDKLTLYGELNALKRKTEDMRSEQFVRGIDLALSNLKLVCKPVSVRKNTFWGGKDVPHVDFLIYNGDQQIFQSRWPVDNDDSRPIIGRVQFIPTPLSQYTSPEAILSE